MEVKLPLEAVASLVSKSPDELKAELFEGEGESIKQKATAHDYIREALGGKIKSVGEDQYKRRERELKTQYERLLAEKGIDAKGRQFDEILEELATKATAKPADQTAPLEELLKRRDVSDYLKTATEQQVAALKKQLEATTQELTQTRTEYTRTQKLTAARAALERELDALGWDDGGELRTARLELLAKQLPVDQIKVENGQVVLLDEKGEPMRDNLHNPVPFSAWVEKVNVFPKAPGAAPRPTAPTGTQAPAAGTLKLASEQAGLEMLAAERDPAKRAQILRAMAELGRKK